MGFKDEVKGLARVFGEAVMETVVTPLAGALYVAVALAMAGGGLWAIVSGVRWLWEHPIFH